MLKKVVLILAILLEVLSVWGQHRIAIVDDAQGSRLTIDGKVLFVNGMNWDYTPIGTNYAYNLWDQPEEMIRKALDNEMTMLKKMGVNVIRQYATIPPRWVQYIYEHYGIYTMINHSFGRYGLVANGVDYSNTDYCLEDIRTTLLQETDRFVKTYKDIPGVLLYLLGNENNYGLFWGGAETEDIPVADRKSTLQAKCMYRLMNEATQHIKAMDDSRPVAICNGDLLFLDIIAEECTDADILGINCYRGYSFEDLFREAKEKYGKPVLLTEFGADALNAVTGEEAQQEQADILLANWQEIYMNAAGMGLAGNCLGGFTFQFSDGWWKYGQTWNLDIHDKNASWVNGGYQFDYAKGQNNMNEEWFGICAKGHPDEKGLYKLYPRQAYYLLKKVHRLFPYSSTPAKLRKHFKKIQANIKK